MTQVKDVIILEFEAVSLTGIVSETASATLIYSFILKEDCRCIPGLGRQRQQVQSAQGSHSVGILGRNAFELCGLGHLKKQKMCNLPNRHQISFKNPQNMMRQYLNTAHIITYFWCFFWTLSEHYKCTVNEIAAELLWFCDCIGLYGYTRCVVQGSLTE